MLSDGRAWLTRQLHKRRSDETANASVLGGAAAAAAPAATAGGGAPSAAAAGSGIVTAGGAAGHARAAGIGSTAGTGWLACWPEPHGEGSVRRWGLSGTGAERGGGTASLGSRPRLLVSFSWSTRCCHGLPSTLPVLPGCLGPPAACLRTWLLLTSLLPTLQAQPKPLPWLPAVSSGPPKRLVGRKVTSPCHAVATRYISCCAELAVDLRLCSAVCPARACSGLFSCPPATVT